MIQFLRVTFQFGLYEKYEEYKWFMLFGGIDIYH